MRRPRYIRGTHNAISDRSGFQYKAKDMKLEWNGLLVGRDEFEEKQPQLTLRPRPDRQAVRNVRTPADDIPQGPDLIGPVQYLLTQQGEMILDQEGTPIIAQTSDAYANLL